MQDLVLSGVKPTSIPHLGNYIGALKYWVELQHTYRCAFMIADLHAITVPQNPAELRARTIDTAAMYFAVGILPERCFVFVQSEVPQHAELGWILGTIAKMGEMERMTQFKDKSAKEGRERSGIGLFTYPALMAADILMYDTTAVPVGEDQLQHLELTRTLAQRFNTHFGPTFNVPEALIQKHGARIMSLAHPDRKMSKSDVAKNGTIFLDDDTDTIRHKISRAVTDSGSTITFDPIERPALANLMTIYHHMTGKTMPEIEQLFAGKGFGDFKKELAEVTINHLGPIRHRLLEFRKDPSELMTLLNKGRDQAQKLAEQKMTLVRDRVGLGRA